MFRDLYRFMTRHEPWWCEFFSGCTVIGWAALSIISSPPLASWPSMKIATELFGEDVWNWAAALLGVAQLLALALDRGTQRRTRSLRWVIAFSMCVFWGIVTSLVQAAVPWSPAVAPYAGWCAANILSILLLLRPLSHD